MCASDGLPQNQLLLASVTPSGRFGGNQLFITSHPPPWQVTQGFVRIEPVTMDIATRSYGTAVCLRALSLKRVNPSTGRSSTLIDSFIFFGPFASHQGRLKWIAPNPSPSSMSLLAAVKAR